MKLWPTLLLFSCCLDSAGQTSKGGCGDLTVSTDNGIDLPFGISTVTVTSIDSMSFTVRDRQGGCFFFGATLYRDTYPVFENTGITLLLKGKFLGLPGKYRFYTFGSGYTSPFYVVYHPLIVDIPVNDTSLALSMFPNPASGRFFVTSRNSVIEKIEIFSSLGKLTDELFPVTPETVISLQDYPPGIYYVRVVMTGKPPQLKKLCVH